MPAELEHDASGLTEALDGVVDLAEARSRIGDAQVSDRVLWVEIDDLLEDVERVAFTPLLTQARGHFVVGGEGVACQSELRIDLGEPGNDVSVASFEMRGVAPDDAADLFVDRDGFDREPFPVVVLTDLLVRGDRLLVLVEFEVQVADLQERADIAGILGNEFSILHNRLVVAFLVDKLLRGFEYLLSINRHGGLNSSFCRSLRETPPSPSTAQPAGECAWHHLHFYRPWVAPTSCDRQ